jgi:MFS transporter, DHA2 family, multidrug resistance protein
MPSVAVQSPVATERQINPWLIAVVVSLAAFMEVLDTSIANVALPHIAGSVGASNDESTWVLTSYLVANAIVLPITGWLVGVLGRKRLLLICIATFTASSLLCGIAPSLGLLLLFRVLQGAGGGGLQPLAQAILADTFPPEKQGLAFSLYGVTAIIAPAIGPTFGGWLTDNYSWRWIFLINLPVGLIAMLLVYLLVSDPPYMKLARDKKQGMQVDYLGFSLLAIGVGALQVALDKGQEEDWFNSELITTLAVVAAVGLTALVIYEWFHKKPIVEVKLFKNFNFAAACLMMFVVGALSFSTTVLMPQFLQGLMGYTAEKAGMVMSAAAVFLLVEFPLVGRLTGKIQARFLIAFGWGLLAGAMYYSTQQIDLQMSFGSAMLLRIFQYLPMGFIFIPATMAAYVGIGQDKRNEVAGLVNFVRNIGSGVGTSVVTTILARRAQFHQLRLAEHTAANNRYFVQSWNNAGQLFAAHGMALTDAQRHALAMLYAEVQRQASSLAYLDTYWVLGCGAALMFALSFFLRKNKPGGGGQTIAH